MKTLEQKIQQSNAAQVDALWAILKYKQIGILRKLQSMCEVIKLPFESLEQELPKDSEGRILDFESRKQIHTFLINKHNQ